MKKQLSLYVMAGLYFFAGVNHFINPGFYYRIIPHWLGDPVMINVAAGVAEIGLAILLLFHVTRKMACYGIILMLLAFIPVHIYMLEMVPDVRADVVKAPIWILWLRLLVIQPLLIWWAFSLRNKK
jgi:uncharacterized membrane protein